ncbi:MAG: FtsX-like permease family protein [Thermoanaerobaculia bacterium]|nr:FtsX-like permease family protein [Thermoanaerobaculia bacterium]
MSLRPGHGSPLLSGRQPLSWVLAWRYLRGRRSRVLTATAGAALLAVTLGVTALVVAMALMSGYTGDLQRKLIGLQGEVLVTPALRGLDTGAATEVLSKIDGVVRASRVAYAEGSVSSAAAPDGEDVVIRGIETGSLPGLKARAQLSVEHELFAGDKFPGVVLGKQLQERLGAATGEVLRLVVLSGSERDVRFRYRSVKVAGTFTTGFAEFDARWLLVERGRLEELRGELGLDAIELEMAEAADAQAVADEAQERLGETWFVQRWRSLNRELFAALELQETLLFLVLGLIVVVSTFNVAATLVILVRDRIGDIGVLSALGMEPRQLWWSFTGYGLALGAAGTAIGIAIGAGASWLITRFELIRFDPDVAAIYFIESVPFDVELGDILLIAGFSLSVTFLACAFPARRAARLGPAEALRKQ